MPVVEQVGVVSAKPNVTDLSLRPSKPASQPSELRDDPMWLDFESEGLDSFTAYRPRNEFTTSFERLDSIIDQTYDTLNSSHRGFAKNVSRSAYSYYTWQHAYARVIAIKKHRGEESFTEDRHLEYLRGDTHPLPAPIEEYLRAVKDINDTTGITYKIAFHVWSNRHGHFQRISAQTHSYYESLAAPVVIARRVIEDLLYTQNPARKRNWNVPANIAPEEDEAGLPTKNLLGWAPAVTLTNEQRQLLESAGLVGDEFNLQREHFSSMDNFSISFLFRQIG